MPNPMEIMKLMGMWNTFKSNHPKFPKFMAAAAQPGVITEDTIPDGRTMETNLKITASDLEMIQQLKNIR